MQRLIPVACAILVGACTFADTVETLDTTLLRRACADPWLFRHEGRFYLTQTGATKVRVLESDTLAGLAASDCVQSIAYDSAGDPTVKALGYAGVSGTWSPEIHHFTDADFPGHAGWYMFVAIRDAAPGDARHVKSVVLKSLSGDPAGPYGHPVTGEKFASQLVLDKDGQPYAEWALGQSALVIRTGTGEPKKRWSDRIKTVFITPSRELGAAEIFSVQNVNETIALGEYDARVAAGRFLGTGN